MPEVHGNGRKTYRLIKPARRHKGAGGLVIFLRGMTVVSAVSAEDQLPRASPGGGEIRTNAAHPCDAAREKPRLS